MTLADAALYSFAQIFTVANVVTPLRYTENALLQHLQKVWLLSKEPAQKPAAVETIVTKNTPPAKIKN